MSDGHGPEKNRAPGRRLFLRAGVLGTGAAALASLGCGRGGESERPAPTAPPSEPTAPAPEAAPSDALPDGLDPRNFIVHGREPMTLETRRDRFGTSVITPTDRFFVRNNLPLPPAEIVQRPDDWELRIEGVAAPRAVTVREMKTWGVETLATVTQCSGNGRQFFAHETSGSQWGVGAAACTIWSGVPLRVVAERLGGASDGRRFLTATGGEALPEGVDRASVVVERSIPRDKALDDCLLAWELNGAPIPITHGGPLRLIVPGYFGCNQIKYVAKIAFTERETDAHIMQRGYRLRAIGESGAPDQPSMWQMSVKSWINGPSGRHPVARGPLQVHGVAFSGGHGIDRVEVSTDGGTTWQAARLTGPDLGPYAWRQFTFETVVELGQAHFMSRAVDREGNMQPEHRVENHRGYGHNGWRDLGVHFDVVEGPVVIEEEVDETSRAIGPAPGSLELSEDAQAGRELFVSEAAPPCGTCHTLSEADTTGTVGPNLNVLSPSEEQVVRAVRQGVGAMPGYGEQLSEEQIRQLAAYVRAAMGS